MWKTSILKGTAVIVHTYNKDLCSDRWISSTPIFVA